MDETTDRGDDKQAAMLVQYFDDRVLKVMTKFYRVKVVNFAFLYSDLATFMSFVVFSPKWY